MDDKAEKAIEYAKELLSLYNYGTPLTYGDDENEMVKMLLMIIERKDCVIETQAHNEEVLMEYVKKLENKDKKCTDKEWSHCRVEKMRL